MDLSIDLMARGMRLIAGEEVKLRRRLHGVVSR
jgi:hypothetical protein